MNLATGRAARNSIRPRQHEQERRIAQAISEAGYPTIRRTPQTTRRIPWNVGLSVRPTRPPAGVAGGGGCCVWLPVEVAHWISQLTGREHYAMAAQSMAMGWVALISSTAALIFVGSRFYASAWKARLHRTRQHGHAHLDRREGGVFYSLAYFIGGLAKVWPARREHDLYFMEASGLLALDQPGHWLESRCGNPAGSAIRELLQTCLRRTALRIKGRFFGDSEEIPASRWKFDDLVLVRPGRSYSGRWNGDRRPVHRR